MDEEKFNMEMRKFLKKVGINSQRLIEQHVREAIAAGRIEGHEQLEVRATLEIEGLGLKEPIDGKIKLE
jgi:predicted transcriptional regulator